MAIFTRTKAVVAAVAAAATAGIWWAAAHGQLTKIAATIENLIRSERAKPAGERRISEAEAELWEANLRKWSVEFERIKELGSNGLRLLTKKETQAQGEDSLKRATYLAEQLVKESMAAAARATNPRAKAAFISYVKTLQNNIQRLAAEAARARQAPEASDAAAVAQISEWVHFVETDLRRIGSDVRDISNKTNTRLEYERVAVQANQALGRAQALRKGLGSRQRAAEMGKLIARLTAAVKEANNAAAQETRRRNFFNSDVQQMIKNCRIYWGTSRKYMGRKPNPQKAMAQINKMIHYLAKWDNTAKREYGNCYHLFRPYHDSWLAKANAEIRNLQAMEQKMRAARARR